MIERIYQADFSEPKLGFTQMVSNLEDLSLEDQHFLKPLGNGTTGADPGLILGCCEIYKKKMKIEII